ncbi:C40 family peptidase [Mycolicibacterium senegalense]|uniref:C40 family peptidase n=1 Tax=Mycolicibacterium senegalense TaxID=1796 RepID=UPI003AACFB12
MSGQSVGEAAVEIAYGYLGLPYVFAGGDLDGPTNGGFDRAGLVRYVVYAATGTDIGRTLDAQLEYCERLPAGQVAQPGDVLFWTSPGGVQRVYQQAIYTGMMTVIALVPEDLAVPGVLFDTRTTVGVMGAVFHEQGVEADLITAKPPAGPGESEVVVARPPCFETRTEAGGGCG